MANKSVDYEALHACIVQQCERRGMSRRMAAAEIGIPPGTFTRIKKGQGVADYTFVSLMNWLGADESIRPFLKGSKPSDAEPAADTQE